MTNDKLKKEKQVCFLMIDIYCKKKHKLKKDNCNECQELKDYVSLRLSKCPFRENKKFCSNCKIHCYQKDMREKIKKVMRFSGKRMIIYHPILAIRHLMDSNKEKKNDKK